MTGDIIYKYYAYIPALSFLLCPLWLFSVPL